MLASEKEALEVLAFSLSLFFFFFHSLFIGVSLILQMSKLALIDKELAYEEEKLILEEKLTVRPSFCLSRHLTLSGPRRASCQNEKLAVF